MSGSVIELAGVWKTYPIARAPLDWVRWALPGSRVETVDVLRDITLRISDGEVVGLIGRNGAGKSTLLRVLAGLAPVTRGELHVRGRAHPLLDLSAGLDRFLSGRQNAAQRLKLLGVDRGAIPRLIEEVAAFAELEDAMDEPLFALSTGMRMRLAFAIATAIEPEVLLLDEVLAVGDRYFAAKSFRRIRELAARGRATVVASHDWRRTFQLCPRVVWVDGGRIRADGPPATFMHEYFREVNAFGRSLGVSITGVRMLDPLGAEATEVDPADACTLELAFRRSVPAAPFCVAVEWQQAGTGETTIFSYSGDEGLTVTGDEPAGVVRVRYDPLPLSPGEHLPIVYLIAPGAGPAPTEFLDIWGPPTERWVRLRVRGDPAPPRLFEVPVRWTVEVA